MSTAPAARPEATRSWRLAVDLLLPSSCLGCGRAGADLCEGCASPLRADPRMRRVGGDRVVWSATGYDGVVRAALVAHKERGARSLTPPLAAALASAVAAALVDAVRPAAGAPPIALVPVPSSPAAVRRRGDDTVLTLTRAAADLLRRAGADARAVRALRLTRRVSDSRTLGAAARRRNLADAFDLRPRASRALRGRAVVVVDDLVTTGASVLEAARALRHGGVEVLSVATVASTSPNG